MRSVLRVLVTLLALVPVVHAQPDRDAIEQARAQMSAASGGEVRVTRSRASGLATFVAAERGRSISVAGRTAEERARGFLSRYASLFGVRGDAASLATIRVRERDEVGMDHVRLQQRHQGVPVTGAEIIVHLRGSGVVSANGRSVGDLGSVDMTVRLEPADAIEHARRAVARAAKGTALSFSTPRLEVLNRGLLEGAKGSSRLAWFVEASGVKVRERVFIDARTGQTLLRYSQLTDAKKRTIYDGQSAASLPGKKIRKEGAPATGDTDADLAYQYLGDTYDYYFSMFGRDSYDGKGGDLKATVHHCPSPADCPFQNAFWNGSQMVFGDGFSAADDVDGHELTHAVTEKEAGLFYYMQSGALNESFSDIFGESIDLGNGSGTDTSGVRWLMGEDVPVFGALRDMYDPSSFGDPGKMSDSLTCEEEPFYQDQGGVHTNSGIPNHAYALMVDGGSFNSVTVTGIGLDKAARIQYRALTQYLNSASDFLEDYNALRESCEDLVGTHGISSGDCTEVENALEAVEMEDAFSCTPVQPDPAAYCDGGNVPLNVLFDDLEKSDKGWKSKAFVGPKLWYTKNAPLGPFATSGNQSLWGYDYNDVAVALVEQKKGVTIPPNAFLRFNHSFGFDNWAGTAFDGGVPAFTLDGSSYFLAGSMIDSGAGLNATITSAQNPLDGTDAFGYASWGYTSTRLDLSSLVGLKPKFAFFIGTDESVDDYGWYVDDVQIYTCQAAPALSIQDASRKEGKKLTFEVSLAYASGAPVSFRYKTSDGSASAGSDYAAATGLLTFAPGVTKQSVEVTTFGDTAVEPNEVFTVELEDVVGAAPGDTSANGTILNDD